jgi:exodeoxyribonuclease VII large subunit
MPPGDLPLFDSVEPAEPALMTVTQLTLLIQDRLREGFSDISLVGEVSRVTYHRSGHVYLTLKDEGAVLDAVIWRGTANKLRFKLDTGLEVVCSGSVDVYPPRGSYQLIIRKIEPRGEGALQLMYRKLLEQLRDEGLFDADRKKPLPEYPRRIGLVTSPTGAAVRDMIRIIRRRWPLADMLLFPVRVQGEAAAGEIAAAIEYFNDKLPEFDVLIVGRGGGSLEDLWAFNEEVVARAIAASEIPVVSAVGHETDFTISDFVADLRAATPSEAAEVVAPDRAELVAALRERAGRLAGLLRRRVRSVRERLDALGRSYILRRPETMLRVPVQRLDEAFESFQDAFERRQDRREEALRLAAGRLEALSPLKVLGRGFSVTLDAKGNVLRDAADVSVGDEIRTQLQTGSLHSKITATDPDDTPRVEAPPES